MICSVLLFPIVKDSVSRHNATGDLIVIGLTFLTLIILIIGLRLFFLTKNLKYLVFSMLICATCTFWIMEFSNVECVACKVG